MDKKVKKETLRRLKIIEGHLKRVVKMVEEDSYCPDIIHQSQAISAALKSTDEVVLHGHLHSCVLKDIHGTNREKEKLVEELVDLFKKHSK